MTRRPRIPLRRPVEGMRSSRGTAACTALGIAAFFCVPAHSQAVDPGGEPTSACDRPAARLSRGSGLFAVHEQCGRVYYEIPPAMLGRAMLINTEFAALKERQHDVHTSGRFADTRLVRWLRNGDQVRLELVKYEKRRVVAEDQQSAPGQLAADGLIRSFTVLDEGTDGAPITIDAGQTLAALDGPVASDGFDWYLVQPIGGRGAGQLGWAATPQEGDSWLVPGELECSPALADLTATIPIGPAAALYCSGGADLSLEGYVVTGFGCNVMGTFEPEWLAHPCANMSYISPAPPTENDRQLFLHYPAPGVPNPTLSYSDEQFVRIVGHYDDPAAAGCVIEPDELDPGAPPFGASDPAADVAECRLRFVVTEVTPLP